MDQFSNLLSIHASTFSMAKVNANLASNCKLKTESEIPLMLSIING